MQDNTTKQNDNNSKLTEEKVLKKAEELASKKSQENAQKLKEELISSLAGRKEDALPWEKEGKKDPDSWQQVIKTAEEKAYKRAQKAFDKKLNELEKRREQAKKQESEKYKKKMLKKQQEYSRDFMDLIEEGKVQIEDEVLEKLKKGEQLGQDEMKKSKGIKTWQKLRDLAYENNTSLYKAYHKHYDKAPAGANAPVFGNFASNQTQSEDDYTYEEIRAARKKLGL
jgi:hypothetical protein